MEQFRLPDRTYRLLGVDRQPARSESPHIGDGPDIGVAADGLLPRAGILRDRLARVIQPDAVHAIEKELAARAIVEALLVEAVKERLRGGVMRKAIARAGEQIHVLRNGQVADRVNAFGIAQPAVHAKNRDGADGTRAGRKIGEGIGVDADIELALKPEIAAK